MKNKNNIKANQKSFFFDDYSDSEIIFDKKNQSLGLIDLGNHILIIGVVLLAIFIIKNS